MVASESRTVLAQRNWFLEAKHFVRDQLSPFDNICSALLMRSGHRTTGLQRWIELPLIPVITR